MLRQQDAARLITQTHSDKTVLVGGQAVAFWAGYFGIKSALPVLTSDIDYIGTATEARRASARLDFAHRLKIATLDDATPNTAVITVTLRGYEEPVLIDYLAEIIGLDSKQIQASAVVADLDSVRLRVLHPVQLLQSKIWNLHRLESKRTPEGFEQARLAIRIVAALIRARIKARATPREILRIVEAAGKFSATLPAVKAYAEWRLDCLAAIPKGAGNYLPAEFREKRWPQIKKHVASIRRRHIASGSGMLDAPHHASTRG